MVLPSGHELTNEIRVLSTLPVGSLDGRPTGCEMRPSSLVQDTKAELAMSDSCSCFGGEPSALLGTRTIARLIGGCFECSKKTRTRTPPPNLYELGGTRRAPRVQRRCRRRLRRAPRLSTPHDREALERVHPPRAAAGSPRKYSSVRTRFPPVTQPGVTSRHLASPSFGEGRPENRGCRVDRNCPDWAGAARAPSRMTRTDNKPEPSTLRAFAKRSATAKPKALRRARPAWGPRAKGSKAISSSPLVVNN